MLNGRDGHQQTLTARKVDGPLLAGRPALGGGGRGLAQPGMVVLMMLSDGRSHGMMVSTLLVH